MPPGGAPAPVPPRLHLRGQARAVVPDGDPQHPRRLPDRHLHRAVLHPLQSVEDGVFHQGLENHLGNPALRQLLRQ